MSNLEFTFPEYYELPPSMVGGVLLPTGKKLKSYGCMRSLSQHGIDTIVASEFDRIPHYTSRYCTEPVHLSTSPADVIAYKNELVQLARRPDVATIIPIRECDVYVLAKYHHEFAEHVSLVIPDFETLKKAHDRLQLAKEAEKAGVPVANTRLVSNIDQWDTDVVIKSRYNLLTVDYIDSYPPGTVQEQKHIQFLPKTIEPDADALREGLHHEPIAQDFVPQAKKHLYCALWEHGEPRATYQHEQLRQNSWVGGGGVYRESVQTPEVDAVAADLLRHLEWHGLACIEYVKDATTGEWKFLEINPRVWQSIPEAVRANADFPYYYWLAAHGKSDQIDPSYTIGMKCHNAYGELGHLVSVVRDDSPFVDRPKIYTTTWDIVRSIVRHPRFEYLRLDDPGFFLYACREAFLTGVTPSRHYESGQSKASAPVS